MKAKAQSVSEIVIVSACVLAVLIVMGGYVQKTLSGKYKQMSDTGLSTRQYDPEHGNHIDMISTSGRSSSVTRAVRTEVGEDQVKYMVSYQAAGYEIDPTAENREERYDRESDRDLKERTFINSQMEMEDLEIE